MLSYQGQGMSAFTINACNRCRKRKSRCDTGIPTCGPCQDSGSRCEWTDPRTKLTLPRQSILELEEDLTRLELQLEDLKRGVQSTILLSDNDGGVFPPSSSAVVQSSVSPAQTDRSRPDTVEHTHFLGASSGIQLARSLLESTRSDYVDFANDQLPNATPSTSLSLEQPTDPPTRDACYPTNAPPPLPSLQTTLELIDMFFDRDLIQYPVLIPNEFKPRVIELHERIQHASKDAQDPCLTFMLYIVLSISLSLVAGDDSEAKVQAKTFNAYSMARLGSIMRIKSAQSLQCLLLLLLSALVNSTSAPIWTISGLCIRMVVDLGYHSETTICMQGRDTATGQEIALKRRLFWVSYTLDRSLATILGRPFTLSDDIIDVGLPYDSLPEDMRPHILQWLQLQRLQSQAVSRLYTVPHVPADAQWMAQMRQDIDTWLEQACALPLLKQWNPDRWRYWYYTFLLVLHRPSPMSRKLDPHDYITAFYSAKNMIHIAFLRNHQLPHDVDCIELHSQVLSGIILLFLVLKSADVRAIARDDWLGYRSCLMQWRFNMDRHSHRWENMVRTQNVMAKLADAAVAIVEKQATAGSARLFQSSTEAPDLFNVPPALLEGMHPQAAIPDGLLQPMWSSVPRGSNSTLSGSDGGFDATMASSHGYGGLSSSAQTIPSHGTYHGMSEAWNESSASQDNVATGFQEGSDLSMMLNDDIWSGLDFADGNLSILDFLQYPLAGSETLGLPLNPVELSSMDGGMTGSMLNFREDEVVDG